jgi:2-phospho-L-lactate guanylyltransferase
MSFDAAAFAGSGLRLLRLGQRVVMRVEDGKVVAITHVTFPLP